MKGRNTFIHISKQSKRFNLSFSKPKILEIPENTAIYEYQLIKIMMTHGVAQTKSPGIWTEVVLPLVLYLG